MNMQTIIAGVIALAGVVATTVLTMTGHPVPDVIAVTTAASIGGFYGGTTPAKATTAADGRHAGGASSTGDQ